MAHLLALACPLLAGLSLWACGHVSPAVETRVISRLRSVPAHKIAVLPVHVSGYRADEIRQVTDRITGLVELSILRQGLPVIEGASFGPKLTELKFEPRAELDVPSARLLRRLTGATLVIQGAARAVRGRLLSEFEETLHAIDTESGEVVLRTKGRGDSDVFRLCAQDLAEKLRGVIALEGPSRP